MRVLEKAARGEDHQKTGFARHPTSACQGYPKPQLGTATSLMRSWCLCPPNPTDPKGGLNADTPHAIPGEARVRPRTLLHDGLGVAERVSRLGFAVLGFWTRGVPFDAGMHKQTPTLTLYNSKKLKLPGLTTPSAGFPGTLTGLGTPTAHGGYDDRGCKDFV